MPTALERNGDFSQTVDGLGRPITVIDPTDRPAVRQQHHPARPHQPGGSGAARLLPAADSGLADGGYNYQAPILSAIRTDSFQSRVTQVVNQRNQIFGTGSYSAEHGRCDHAVRASSIETQTANTDVAVNWNRRVSQFLQLRTRYQFTKQSTTVTPFFANRINVSGEAGITGNNQEPINWGPPSLSLLERRPDSRTDCRDNPT